MNRDDLMHWVADYEAAWRTAGTDALTGLFAEDATYLTAPFRPPLRGRAAIASFWAAERTGSGEAFEMKSQPVAVEGDTGVVRVEVRYGAPAGNGHAYRDLWVVTLDGEGHCTAFEEWPFHPGQARSAGGGNGRGRQLAAVEETSLGITWVLDDALGRTCHALVHEGRVWLVDPVAEPEALALAAGLGRPAGVIQLLDRHNRDCAAVADELGVRLERLPSALPETPFEVVPVVDMPVWHEVALWWPAQRALVVAEALGTAPTFSPTPLGVGVHIGLRARPPRQLADFDAEHLLVGHGPAVHGADTAAAIREAIEHARRDLPRALAALPKAFLGR